MQEVSYRSTDFSDRVSESIHYYLLLSSYTHLEVLDMTNSWPGSREWLFVENVDDQV